MKPATQSAIQEPPKLEPAWADSGFFSNEAVLNILKLILAGSDLSEVLRIITGLVESQGGGTLCTIWLPDDDGKHLYCAAAPSLPGFAANVGRMSVGPKGGSGALRYMCSTMAHRPGSAWQWLTRTGSP